jgi:hypothetical protein
MLFVPLYFLLLTIVSSVFLRYTDSNYPLGIFKLFILRYTVNLSILVINTISVQIICYLDNCREFLHSFHGVLFLFHFNFREIAVLFKV